MLRRTEKLLTGKARWSQAVVAEVWKYATQWLGDAQQVEIVGCVCLMQGQQNCNFLLSSRIMNDTERHRSVKLALFVVS